MPTELERFIAGVPDHSAPRPEPTLFALGGRGHYENAASDLLAFFLRPDGEHGLGPAFLHAFLECLPHTPTLLLSVEGVTVHREQSIPEGRIDLLVQGGDWCLAIENKFYHALANPLEAYERYAAGLCRARPPLLAILSPDGRPVGRWAGVSYRVFCATARRHLATAYFERPYSKWHVFARELILHLENELYTPAMTPDQITFVERHSHEIEEVIGLAKQYREFLLDYLRQELMRANPGDDFSTRDDRWAIRCYCKAWGDQTNIAFFQDPQRKFPGFFLTVYATALTADHKIKLDGHLHGWTYWTENAGVWHAWRTPNGILDRAEATQEMCGIAKRLSDVLRVAPLQTSSGPTIESAVKLPQMST